MECKPRIVTVYPMTGRQLFLNVPHGVCEECDITVRLLRRITAGAPGVELRVLPWFNHLFDALRRGGWHPPVVTVDGHVFSQGVVPHEGELRASLGLSAAASTAQP